MKNFVQKGDVIDVTAPAAVSSGDLVVVGSFAGVAQTDAASGDKVPCVCEGVFTLTKLSATTFAEGDLVYSAAGVGNNVTATNTDQKVGVVVNAAVTGSTDVVVKLLIG